MAVSRDEVLQVAELARLRLEPEEVDRLAVELNNILEHAAELETIDLEAIDALERGTEVAAPRRSDELGPDLLSLPLEAFALGWEDGFFTVPRVAAMDQIEVDETQGVQDEE